MGIKRVTLGVLQAIFLVSLVQRPIFASKKANSYVVYFGEHSHGSKSSPADFDRVTDSHYEFLSSFLGREKAKEAMFYSYTRHINGFAANLLEEEATEISKHPEVASVFLNEEKHLHTTRSWEFLGLERNGEIVAESIWPKARFGEDVIIANLDTGVWPESESFNDQGMGPIPSKWKGHCDTKDRMRCNRKLIGAKYFHKGYEAYVGKGTLNSSFDTARDTHGHGTHTLSIAGGRFVAGANLLGVGNGTAKGGSPLARVASYKVCWPLSNRQSCFDADILAAFDAAIHDGVDVLSISVGGAPDDYFLDGLAIGSFHAVEKGIVVVCSGGNSGPRPGTISNVAPWIITVGASTMDRDFPSYVTLGNNKQYKGWSSSARLLPEKFYPLIRSIDAKAAKSSRRNASLCLVGSLDPAKVTGKIVSCLNGVNQWVEKGFVVDKAGGIGMIIVNQMISESVFVMPHVLPTSHVSAADGLAINSYIKSTKSPVAYVTGGTTELGTEPAPFMIDFSSQGPNTITPEILKPDITAPGVKVLAAYTQALGPSQLPFDSRRVPFNLISGTSMSCPHISGTVGLLKTLHPEWSPAAIRSAIMTTASTRDNVREPIVNMSLAKATSFNYGAGHVRPNSAMDPGLVYDLTIPDYLNFLCSLGYNTTQMKYFVDEPFMCNPNSVRLENLNYPSITIPNLSGKVTVTRTLKNVGTPGTYSVRTHDPRGISVTIEPETLKFETIGEEKRFTVTVEAKRAGATKDYRFGGLIWSDGEHYVRSPIVVKQKAKS